MNEDAIPELSEFREPGDFARRLDRLRAGLTRKELYGDPKNQVLKDAWQGAMFALGYQEFRRRLVEVRICAPDNFPDFQIRIDGKTFDFEATMILREGRRMAGEYRNDTTLGPVWKEKPSDVPPFDPDELAKAIAKKAAKQYAGKPHLAVYFNTQGKGVELADLAGVAQGPDGNAFESIWIVTDHYIGAVKASAALVAPEGWFRIPIE